MHIAQTSPSASTQTAQTTPRHMVVEPGLPEPCAHCGARSHSVCSALETSNMHRLAEIAVVQSYDPGQTIVEEGDPATHFFNITEGHARLCKLLPDGRRQIIGFPGRGHFLGLAVTDTYGFSVEAIDRLRICRFARPKLRAVITDFPAFEAELLATAQHELVVAQEQMLLLGRKTARERVASFLLSQIKSQEACSTPRVRINLPMTRTDIADYLGLTIETVSRTLGKLKSDRLIALDGATHVDVLDRAKLTAIAAGES